MSLRYRNTSGHVKNRAQTMQRLVEAVGAIIKIKGYKGLGLNAVAKEADVSKSLVYRYFGSLDGLVEAYVLKNDYWIAKSSEVAQGVLVDNDRQGVGEMVKKLLHGHFEYFYTHPEMRSIILWEITEKTMLLNSICNCREEVGGLLLEKAEPLFKGSGKSFKGVTALLVSAIYYMVLHAKKNESTICGIDVNSAAGQKEILDTIDQIVDWACAADSAEKLVG